MTNTFPTIKQTAALLQGIWYLVDDDIDKGHIGAIDADASGRRFGVSRRNIINLAYSALTLNMNTSELFAYISDEAHIVELHERHYGPCTESAYMSAFISCSQVGHITLDSFIHAFSYNLSKNDYMQAVKGLSTALKINITDVPVFYWDKAITEAQAPAHALFNLGVPQ